MTKMYTYINSKVVYAPDVPRVHLMAGKRDVAGIACYRLFSPAPDLGPWHFG
jgi:hypothetical protein